MSDTIAPEKKDAWHATVTATIAKWTCDPETGVVLGDEPAEVLVVDGNVLLNAGITRILNLLIGTGATQAFDATHTRIGVGDSSTAATASQTDLQAATNKLWNLVTAVGTVSSQTVTFTTTFASGDANFAWNEWAIDQGTAQGTTVTAPCLDRKVASMGTKTSAGSWVISIAITLS